MVCTRLVSDRKKPSLSASSMATRATSGMSSPSRSRLMPTSTWNSPRRRLRISRTRSRVSTSECSYSTLMSNSRRYPVRFSAMRLVSVVTKTR